MSNELWNLKQETREALAESLQWNIDSDKYEDYHDLSRGIEISDLIFETADQMVPIYTYELLELAQDDLYLATEEPELGPAFDGKPTVVNIIAANVFEALESDLWEYWNELESDDSDLTFPEVEENEESDDSEETEEPEETAAIYAGLYTESNMYFWFLKALDFELKGQNVVALSWIRSMKDCAGRLYGISL